MESQEQEAELKQLNEAELKQLNLPFDKYELNHWRKLNLPLSFYVELTIGIYATKTKKKKKFGFLSLF